MKNKKKFSFPPRSSEKKKNTRIRPCNGWKPGDDVYARVHAHGVYAHRDDNRAAHSRPVHLNTCAYVITRTREFSIIYTIYIVFLCSLVCALIKRARLLYYIIRVHNIRTPSA